MNLVLLAKNSLKKNIKVATQNGVIKGKFFLIGVVKITEWIQSGVIGEVYEVHCWTDRPIWPQGLMHLAII